MKKTIAFLLAVIMVLGIVPVGTIMSFAANDATIKVESVSAMPDSTVDVAITIADNPGIASMGFTLSFGEELTLVGATNGEAFSELTLTPPAQLKKTGSVSDSCRFAWLGSDNVTENGVILNLKFKVKSDAELDKDSIISIICDNGDVLDDSRKPVNVTTQNGVISIIDYVPGDVDGSKTITMMDVLTLCQFYVDGCKYDPNGYAVDIKPESGDVDANGYVNMLDVLMICQFYVDDCKYDPNGYAVILLPGKKACDHMMEHIDAVEATCTESGNREYWHCLKCNDYFADAEGKDIITFEYTVVEEKGHHPVSVDAVPATTETVGYTEGIWCDECEQWLSGHIEFGPIEPDEANISYSLFNLTKKAEDGSLIVVQEDNFLKEQIVENDNPNKYTVGVGVPQLKIPTVAGYEFLGWYEAPDLSSNRVISISTSEEKDVILYAIWKKVEYKIIYLPDSSDSTLPRIEGETFTVDEEKALKTPEWKNLVWVGWSDEEGNIIKSVKKGTAHDVTLTANWMSKRNQTIPNTKYATSAPAISKITNINGDKGLYYTFTYEIGDIQNVPIQQVEEGVEGKGFNLVKGATHEIDKGFTEVIGRTEAESVANVVANSTTKSDSMTLSENWNKSTTFSEEHQNEITEEQLDKSKMAFSNSSSHSISAGMGGTTTHIDETGKSSKVTKKNEFNVSLNAGLNTKIKKLKGDLNVGVGLGYKHSKETEDETHETHTDEYSTTWNTNESFETSSTFSQEKECSHSIAQSIKDTFGYSETLDFGGSQSETVSSSNTSSQSREHSSSVTYSTETGSHITVKEILTADADVGYYRKVLAANFKVFAVVIYDVKKQSFSTMTYSLKINDSEHLFTDYSTSSAFNDYENGVLPFDVPYDVTDYVYNIVGISDGIKVDEATGIVESYGYKDETTGICYKKYDDSTGIYSEPCDTDVVIPQYTVINGKIVEIKGISANVFSGTNVTSVYLNSGIKEIPKEAFKGCSSLKYVTGENIQSIGESAFDGCSSLFEMNLDSNIVSLGENAFKGAESLTIIAANSEVAKAAINSGVNKLTLDLSEISDSLDNTKIVTPDTMISFTLIGNGNTYNNLILESDAETVEISDISLISASEVPLKLSSKNINLSFTSISSPGFAMMLLADNTNVVLDGNNYINTNSENAVLCKNVILKEKADSVAVGRMRLNGNLLHCGTLTGKQYLTFDSGEHTYKEITQDEYDNYFNVLEILFDANGGIFDDNGQSYSTKTKEINIGSSIGDIPIPTKEHYSFDGWYTEDGEKISSDRAFYKNETLYAHWTLLSYTVKFDANGGTVDTTSCTVIHGSTITLPTPTRSLYVFNGWFTASSGGVQYTDSTEICSNVTLYAQWTAKTKKTISYSTSSTDNKINVKWASTGLWFNGVGNATLDSGSGVSGWSDTWPTQGTWNATTGLSSGGTVFEMTNIGSINSAVKKLGSNVKISSIEVKAKRYNDIHGNETAYCHLWASENTVSKYAYETKPTGSKVVDGTSWKRGEEIDKKITDTTILNKFLNGTYKSFMFYAGTTKSQYAKIEKFYIKITYEYYV